MRRDFFGSLLIALITILLFGLPSQASTIKSSSLQKGPAGMVVGPKVPVIQNVGVVPLQTEGASENTNGYIDRLSAMFTNIVQDSRRFRVINDQLIASLWETKEGRTELQKDFEIHAYIGLVVTERADVTQLTAQLLDQKLKPLILESDTILRHTLAFSNDQDMRLSLENLVFRLFNRIPIDVSITSVQGPYITLSGGSDQAIEGGDNVEVVRTTIRSVHPANGTWLEFNRQPLGTAKVLEVKHHTSIGKITSQTFENAIEVGDGAKIAAIAARRKFASLVASNTLKDSGDQESIVVPPVYFGPPPAAPPGTTPQPKNEPKNTAENKKQPSPDNSNSMDSESNDKNPNSDSSDAKEEPVKDEPTVWDNFSDEATSHKLLDAITIYGGPYWWAVKGPTNSSGHFPIWLLNNVGGSLTRTMFYKIKASFGGGGIFGNTPDGSYLGYDSFARIYWESAFAQDFLSYWRAGGAGTFSGVNVSKGGYGGGDWIRGGFFGGIGGQFAVGQPEARIDWFTDFTISPLNIGRVGYDGSFKDVESTFGWRWELGGWLWAPPDALQFGGSMFTGDEMQTLKNGRRPHFEDFSIKAMVRFNL